MTIEQLGNIGEFVGSIGVLATLIYLAIQTQQNRKSIEEHRSTLLNQTIQSRAQHYAENQNIFLETDFAEIWVKFHQEGSMAAGWEALDPVEQTKLARFFMGRLNALDGELFLYDRGALDSAFTPNVMSNVRLFYPYWHFIGALSGPGVRPGFKERVDEIIAEHGEIISPAFERLSRLKQAREAETP